MTNFDINILSQNWMPTQETKDLLKLNEVSPEHIEKSLAYLKSEYPDTHIDDIPRYDTWSSLFVMFCIKSSRAQPTD